MWNCGIVRPLPDAVRPLCLFPDRKDTQIFNKSKLLSSLIADMADNGRICFASAGRGREVRGICPNFARKRPFWRGEPQNGVNPYLYLFIVLKTALK